MTEAMFLQAVMNAMKNGLVLVEDTESLRFKVGLMIGILDYHIPPDLSHQEHRPLMSNWKDPNSYTDERVRRYMEWYNKAFPGPTKLQIVVFEKDSV